MNGLQHALGFIERFVSGATADPIPPSLVPAPRLRKELQVSCPG